MHAEPTMPSLDDLQLFDGCVTLGRFSSALCIPDAATLLGLMDRYHIREALVHEYHARSLPPPEAGNQRLLELVRGEPRLYPAWVLEPPTEPGSLPAEAVVQEMLAAGVRVARLRLRSKGALPWVWEELLGALETHRIPCFFDFGPPNSTLGELQDADVNALRAIAQQHPRLPMVVSHVMGGLGVHPALGYLIRRTENVYLDITGILEYWREAARSAGPERVLFATGMPFTDPGILISNVQYAEGMRTAEKQLICGGNLRRLLGGVR